MAPSQKFVQQLFLRLVDSGAINLAAVVSQAEDATAHVNAAKVSPVITTAMRRKHMRDALESGMARAYELAAVADDLYAENVQLNGQLENFRTDDLTALIEFLRQKPRDSFLPDAADLIEHHVRSAHGSAYGDSVSAFAGWFKNIEHTDNRTIVEWIRSKTKEQRTAIDQAAVEALANFGPRVQPQFRQTA